MGVLDTIFGAINDLTWGWALIPFLVVLGVFFTAASGFVQFRFFRRMFNVLSGTDEDFVREETELLGLTHYFDGGIFGGTPDPAHFSKERVYADLMKRDGIRGDNLLSFGDGPVEIKSTAQLGGLPVAVASDECANGSGKVHAEKRAVLVGAGAEIVIADYRDAANLLSVLLGS